MSPFGKTCTYRENITRYTAATLVWECVPEFNIVRTHAQCHVYLATEALSHTNEWSGGGGPTVVMLSAVDGPPGPSVAAVHGPGGPSMAAALGPGGPIVGGPLVV